MPELDTIRGLAILGVLFYHGFYWSRDLRLYSPWQRHFLTLMAPGQFGVNLFFVLSGFLITGILLDSRNRPDYYGRFYFRRALRILPAYYLTLFLLVILKLTSFGFLLMSLAYSSNMSPLFGIALSYPVLWSLAVEEHFYLIWPMATRRMTPTKLLWTLGAILVLTPISRLPVLRETRIWLFHLESSGWFGLRCYCRNSCQKTRLESQADVATINSDDDVSDSVGADGLSVWVSFAQNCDRGGPTIRPLEPHFCSLVGIVPVDWERLMEATRGASLSGVFRED